MPPIPNSNKKLTNKPIGIVHGSLNVYVLTNNIMLIWLYFGALYEIYDKKIFIVFLHPQISYYNLNLQCIILQDIVSLYLLNCFNPFPPSVPIW